MLSDLKYALRQAAKSPGFTITVVLILAFGIGANTAVFTFIDATLLRSLPVRDPGHLVLATNVRTSGGGAQVNEKLSYPVYEQFRDHAQSLSGAVVIGRTSRQLIAGDIGGGNGVPVQSEEVSGNFFSLLGVPAAAGRTLTPEDDRKGAPHPVAVLNYEFWQRTFGGDPGVLGKVVALDKISFAIVGIAPPGFYGVEVGQPVDLWVPIQTLPLLDVGSGKQLQQPGYSNFLVMGRLRPGTKLQTANAELDLMVQALAASAGKTAAARIKDWGKLVLVPGGSGRLDHRDDFKQLFATLMAVVGLVLVIACANVASLLLARTAARQRELAVRAALGAGRNRLIRQLLMEGLLLAGVGGLLGIAVVYWVMNLLTKLMAGQAESVISLQPNGPILAFAIVATAATGLFIGLIPALRFSQMNLLSALKDQASTATGGSKQRLNQVLVVAQISVSVCLLAGAGLFVRSLQDLKNVDLGFSGAGKLLFWVGFDGNYEASRQLNLAKDLTAGFESLPGVRGATVAQGGMWGGNQLSNWFKVEGYVPRPGENMYAYAVLVGPQFFEKMGIPLLKGRGLGPADVFSVSGATASAIRAVVINESMARKIFGTSDPIGRHLSIGSLNHAEIVGVAPNAKYTNLRDEDSLQVYMPFTPYPRDRSFAMALQTTGNPAMVVSSLAAVVQRIDPHARVFGIKTYDDILNRFLFQERVISQVAGYFGIFALILACVGLYGLLAYNVALRTREIGVRMALGATVQSILSLVLRQAMGLAIVGCAAGVVSAIALVHFIASRLYGVTSMDPLTFLATGGVLLFAALAASWLPARRATRVDPMIALRAE